MKQSELDKLWATALKACAKSRNWKVIRGTPYWKDGGLFFTLIVGTGARERSLHYDLRVKWRTLDDLLWNVLGMQSNLNEPESLRAIGAWTVDMKIVLCNSMKDCTWTTEWIQESANYISSLAAEKAVEIASRVRTIDDYSHFIEEDYAALMLRSPMAVVNPWVDRLLIAVEKGDLAKASAIAHDRNVAGDSGSMQVKGKTFFQHAQAFLSHDA